MKILFLDIDGPMIPGRLYFDRNMTYCNDRDCFIYDPVAVSMVNKICKTTGAKIVFNTAHNSNGPMNGVKGVIYQGLVNGIHAKNIHKEGHTLFPAKLSREGGITNWIEVFGPVEKYCIIDDENFTDDSNLINVDFDIGMTFLTYKKAIDILGRLDGKKESSLIIK